MDHQARTGSLPRAQALAPWLALSLATATVISGCATSHHVVRPPRPVGLTLEEADRIAADFETRHAARTGRGEAEAPASLDEVERIVAGHELERFAAADRFLADQFGPRALALQALLEVTWSDTQLILAEVFHHTSEQLRPTLAELETKERKERLMAPEQQRLAALRESLRESHDTAEALERLAAEHAARGAQLAREITARHPDEYNGWWALAEYHRLRHDWSAFDGAARVAERLRPGAPGMALTRAVAAGQREQDAGRAVSMTREVLAQDPGLVRAQAYLVLFQTSLGDTHAQMELLRTRSPAHPLVVWAGDTVRAAYQASSARSDAGGRLNPQVRGTMFF